MVHIRPKPPSSTPPPPPRPSSTAQTELFSKKFAIINEKHTPPLLALIRELAGRIYRSITLDRSFKWQTHMHAEHMSQGNLSGNLSSLALKKIVQLLEKTDDPPAGLIQALSYAQKTFSGNLTASDIKHDIQKLNVGESLAVSSSSRGHAMILYITCTSDSEGGKKFTVVQHNQGEGIADYHYNKIDDQGKRRFQTALEITDVSEEHLTAEGALFIDQMLNNRFKGTTANFYDNILPLLHGKLSPPSNDERLWSHGQLGGSCSSAAPLSIIRSHLDRASYKAFRDLGRFEMLLKSFSEIKSGWGNTSTQKTVTLEVVKKLEHSLHKRNIALPHELKVIKQKLEIKSKMAPVKEPPLKTLADHINHTFTILNRGKFSQETILSSRENLIKTLKASTIDTITPAETKQLIKVTQKLIDYVADKPLTKDQIYAMTVLSTAVVNFTGLNQDKQHFDKETMKKINNFGSTMHMRYNALALGSNYKNGEIDHYVEHYQKLFFHNSQNCPQGLERLANKMQTS